ncbi:MAG TPA: YihY/virulence factor BrkB family protein [Stenomitos sp.]
MATGRFHRVWQIGLEVAREFGRDQCPFLAAGVCYFVVFSLFPLLLGVVSLLGYVVSPDWAMQQIHAALGKALPAQLGVLAEVLDQVVAARRPSGVIALLLLLWSGRGVFVSLAEALDIIWSAHVVVSWRDSLRRNVLALALAVALGGAAIVLSVAYWGLFLILEVRLPLLNLRPGDVPGVFRGVTFLLSNVLPLVVTVVGLVLVYRYLPLRRLPNRAITVGAVSAAVLWELSRRIFSFYLDHFARFSMVYGPLSGVIAFMLWIYVSAMIFLLGAEIAASCAQAKTPGQPLSAGENSPSAR